MCPAGPGGRASSSTRIGASRSSSRRARRAAPPSGCCASIRGWIERQLERLAPRLVLPRGDGGRRAARGASAADRGLRARGATARRSLRAHPDRRPAHALGLLLTDRDALVQLAPRPGAAARARIRRRARALPPARARPLAAFLAARRACASRLSRGAALASRPRARAAGRIRRLPAPDAGAGRAQGRADGADWRGHRAGPPRRPRPISALSSSCSARSRLPTRARPNGTSGSWATTGPRSSSSATRGSSSSTVVSRATPTSRCGPAGGSWPTATSTPSFAAGGSAGSCSGSPRRRRGRGWTAGEGRVYLQNATTRRPTPLPWPRLRDGAPVPAHGVELDGAPGGCATAARRGAAPTATRGGAGCPRAARGGVRRALGAPAPRTFDEYAERTFARRRLRPLPVRRGRGGRRARGRVAQLVEGLGRLGLDRHDRRALAVPWPRHRRGAHALDFAEFFRRGERRVALGVDAQNETGATRLYERLGMRTLWEAAVWEKELRGS